MTNKYANTKDSVMCQSLRNMLSGEETALSVRKMLMIRKLSPTAWATGLPTNSVAQFIEEIINRQYTKEEFLWFSDPNNIDKATDVQYNVTVTVIK